MNQVPKATNEVTRTQSPKDHYCSTTGKRQKSCTENWMCIAEFRIPASELVSVVYLYLHTHHV